MHALPDAFRSCRGTARMVCFANGPGKPLLKGEGLRGYSGLPVLQVMSQHDGLCTTCSVPQAAAGAFGSPSLSCRQSLMPDAGEAKGAAVLQTSSARQSRGACYCPCLCCCCRHPLSRVRHATNRLRYEQVKRGVLPPSLPSSQCRLWCFTPAGFVLGTVMGTLAVLSVICICREDRCWWLLCCRPRPHRPHSLPGQAGEICRLNVWLCCAATAGLFAVKCSPHQPYRLLGLTIKSCVLAVSSYCTLLLAEFSPRAGPTGCQAGLMDCGGSLLDGLLSICVWWLADALHKDFLTLQVRI